MLENIAKLSVTVSDMKVDLLCPNGASTAIVKEALFQFQKYLGQLEDAAQKASEPESTGETNV